MAYWQPQSTSYGGALETVHNTDFGIAYLAQQAEGAAHVGEFNQPFRDYIALGLGLGGVDHPANVNTIQNRVAALEYNLANGGSLAGIVGSDHEHYIGSLAIAGAQFAAPDYSNAPNLLGGDALEPVELDYADLSPAATPQSGHYSPAWLNTDSDRNVFSQRTPNTLADQVASSLPFASSALLVAHELEAPSLGIASSEILPTRDTTEKMAFLGNSTTLDMHLDLSPDVQDRLAVITSAMRGYNLSGGAVSASRVSMPDVPNMAPHRDVPSRAFVM